MARGYIGGDVIRIDGLRELTRALKATEDGLQKQVNVVFKSAADRVAGIARRRIRSRSGRLAGSIRPYGTQRAAGVRMSRDYAGPYEYGGYPAGREFIPTGRALYPTFRDQADNVRRDIADGLRDVIAKNGLA